MSIDPVLSAARIVYDDRHGNSGFGSGVFVTQRLLLTAAHVVEPPGLASSQRASPDASHIRVESRAFLGARTADAVLLHDDPRVDLALVVLNDPKIVQLEYAAAIRSSTSAILNRGDAVQICGHVARDGDSQLDECRVIAIHGNAGVYICNKAVPKGYSGGPVFADGGLAGIMFARYPKPGQSYFYGGDELRTFLREHGGDELVWIDSPVSSLRRFPLGPGVSKGETLRRLTGVIKAYSKLFGGIEALILLESANHDRITCGPPTGDNGIIEVDTLPQPEDNTFLFWATAFIQAGLKSPRMLASLLLAVEEKRLDAISRSERHSALEYLASLTDL